MPPTTTQPKSPRTASTNSTSPTNSRSGAKRLKPFTLDHFLKYAGKLILDNGEPWFPEDFQIAFVEDLFAGHREIWLVVPEGNGKTTLLAGVALYHADYTPDAAVPIGASSRDQCEVLHNQAGGFVRRSPGFEKRFRVFDGYRRITALRTGGRIQVFAADDRTGDGVIPTLPLLDELHRHRDLRLYRTWRGKLDKRGGQLAAISTAGDPESEFEEVRARHRSRAPKIDVDGGHTRAEGGGMVLHDWAVPVDGDVKDFELVKTANPLSSITEKTLAAKRGSPTMSDPHWKRFVCNIPTRAEGEGITPEEWDALYEEGLEPDLSAWSIAFLDLGWKIDTTAMGVLIWESAERRVIAGVNVIEPPVEEADIIAGMVEIQKTFQPVGWVYDPNASGQQMAQMLDKGTHPDQGETSFDFFEHSQDNAPMSLAASRLDEAIRSGWFVHDGGAILRSHVLNAVRKGLGGEKFRYDRPADAKGARRKKFPIDALTGLLMGNSMAVAEHDKPDEPIAVWGSPR